MHDDYNLNSRNQKEGDHDFFEEDMDYTVNRNNIKRGREEENLSENPTKKYLIRPNKTSEVEQECQEMTKKQIINKENISGQKHKNTMDMRGVSKSKIADNVIEKQRLVSGHAETPQTQRITNATSNSLGVGKVILIKPLSEEKNKFFYNPIEVAKAIQVGITNKYPDKIKEIRTNRIKGLIAVEMKDKEPAIMKKLLEMKQLGKWTVTCYLPNSDVYKMGVIAPISIEAKVDEIKESMQVHGSGKIISIDRLQKRTETGWIPSMSLKLTFEADHLPENVSISHCFYKVRPFVGQPMQCFKCQRLGHTSGSCSSTNSKCMLCAGPHDRTQCKAKELKCANCGKKHTANSKECIVISKACKVEELKANSGMTHREAIGKVYQRENLYLEDTSLETSNISPSPIIGRSRYL